MWAGVVFLFVLVLLSIVFMTLSSVPFGALPIAHSCSVFRLNIKNESKLTSTGSQEYYYFALFGINIYYYYYRHSLCYMM